MAVRAGPGVSERSTTCEWVCAACSAGDRDEHRLAKQGDAAGPAAAKRRRRLRDDAMLPVERMQCALLKTRCISIWFTAGTTPVQQSAGQDFPS